MSSPSQDFGILEALLWNPAEGYFLLDYHMARLERSAGHFGFQLDVGAARQRLLDFTRQLRGRAGSPSTPSPDLQHLPDFTQQLPGRAGSPSTPSPALQFPAEPRKVRLTLARNGDIALTHEAVKPSTALSVALAGEAIQSDDEFLRHKTTRRGVYDRALLAHPGAQDVLLWNERGELTETCHGNVVLEIDGRKLTPPVSSGLLPGVFRASLLDRGEIEEAVLPVKLLKSASSVFMINSVRKWCEVRMVHV